MKRLGISLVLCLMGSTICSAQEPMQQSFVLCEGLFKPSFLFRISTYKDLTYDAAEESRRSFRLESEAYLAEHGYDAWLDYMDQRVNHVLSSVSNKDLQRMRQERRTWISGVSSSYADIQFLSTEDPLDTYSEGHISKGSFDHLPVLRVNVLEDRYPLPRILNDGRWASRTYDASGEGGYLDRLESKLIIGEEQVISCKSVSNTKAERELNTIQSRYPAQSQRVPAF